MLPDGTEQRLHQESAHASHVPFLTGADSHGVPTLTGSNDPVAHMAHASQRVRASAGGVPRRRRFASVDLKLRCEAYPSWHWIETAMPAASPVAR
jgi:hypothetical protein